MKIDKELREYFDELVDEVVDTLPDDIQDLLAVVPIYVEDQPTERILREMEIESPEDLQGLYTPRPVPMIHLFRLGLFLISADEESGEIDEEILLDEIETTILHEIGHHRGMNEGEVDELGFG